MKENRKALLGFIGLVIIGLMLVFLSPNTAVFRGEVKTHKRTKLLLDTYVTIKVRASKNKAKIATDAAFSRMAQIEDRLNRYDEKSEISKINRSAPKPVALSEDTFKAVKLSLKYAKVTDSNFDVTIGPLVLLFDYNKKVVPSKGKIREAKKLVDWRNVVLNEERKTVALNKKGMILDLGGMAKGFAADEAYKVLVKKGIKEGLIDTGSSTYTFNLKKESRLFKVGLKHPRKDKILTVFKVRNKRLSTSGDYQRYFVKSGKRYHHIINPRTGYPAKGLMSVTIISDKSAAETDILSTAIFSMGPDEGIKLARKLKGVEGLLIDSDGAVKSTSKISGLPSRIRLKQ